MDQSKKKKQKSIIHFFSPQSGSNSNIGGASETVIKNVEKRFVCQYCEVKVSHLGALKLHTIMGVFNCCCFHKNFCGWLRCNNGGGKNKKRLFFFLQNLRNANYVCFFS